MPSAGKSLQGGRDPAVCGRHAGPPQGHIVLLQALRRLTELGCEVPWRLAIAGWRTGDEPARLDAFIAEHALADRVHLLGQRSDVSDWLAAADVFVMPSLWEGLPLAILEAMLAGKVIVASATSGIPEAHRQRRARAPGSARRRR